MEIGTYSQVYILVDALDEYPEHDRDNLVTTLQSLANDANFMVTSRNLPSIEQQFKNKCSRISTMDDDVRKYIEDRIPHEIRLARHVQKDPALQDTIITKIVGNVKGMSVLWLSHVLKTFLTFYVGFC